MTDHDYLERQVAWQTLLAWRTAATALGLWRRRWGPAFDYRFRLAAKFTASSLDECWVWKGTYNKYGYGVVAGRLTAVPMLGAFRKRGVRAPKYAGNRMAHRAVYEWLRGSIPEGLDLDHLCRNRGCVNPFHMEAVTRGENVRRGTRWAHIDPERNQRIAAMRAEGASLEEVGASFGITLQRVQQIVGRRQNG